MAREKNGWIKLYSSILDKNWSPVEFKVFVGLLLMANSRKHPDSGLVDKSIREIAERLSVSIGALIEARDKFIREDRLETIKIKTPTHKTKPITAIKIKNFPLYQSKEFVPPSEQSKGECSLSETKNVHSVIQNVHSVEQTVSPSEQSRIQNAPTENTEKHREYKRSNEKQKRPNQTRRHPVQILKS